MNDPTIGVKPCGENITAERQYRGYLIQTVTQPSGRNTYDIRTLAGEPVEWAAESFAVARATVDAYVDANT